MEAGGLVSDLSIWQANSCQTISVSQNPIKQATWADHQGLVQGFFFYIMQKVVVATSS